MTTLKSMCNSHMKMLVKLAEAESARRLEQQKKFTEMIKKGARVVWDIHPKDLGWLKNARGLQ